MPQSVPEVCPVSSSHTQQLPLCHAVLLDAILHNCAKPRSFEARMPEKMNIAGGDEPVYSSSGGVGSSCANRRVPFNWLACPVFGSR